MREIGQTGWNYVDCFNSFDSKRNNNRNIILTELAKIDYWLNWDFMLMTTICQLQYIDSWTAVAFSTAAVFI